MMLCPPVRRPAPAPGTVLPALALLVWLLMPVTPAVAEAPAQRRLSLEGVGSVSATPDMAEFEIGVASRNADPKAALDANSKAAAAMAQVLREAGIKETDIKTRNFSIQPIYDPDPDRRGQSRITGYEARNDISVKTNNIKNLGDILSAVVKNGSNRIASVRFGFRDPSALVARAQIEAVRDAREKAERYAGAAGAKITRLIELSERERPVPVMRATLFEAGALAADAAPVPLAEGQEEIRATVWTVWEID